MDEHAQLPDMNQQHKHHLGGDTPPPPCPWMSLPGEVRLLILEELDKLVPRGVKRCAALPRDVAHLARARTAWPSICYEWQDFFEYRNFSSLTLEGTNDIMSFQRIVTGARRGMLRRVRLHVRLVTYPCASCAHGEYTYERESNNEYFSSQVHSLLHVLSRWPPPRQPAPSTGNAGLTLELSAMSPSDTEHRFGRLLEDGRDWPGGRKCCERPHLRRCSGSKLRTVGNLLNLRADNALLLPDFLNWFRLESWESMGSSFAPPPLPLVPNVTRFVISRRCFRSLTSLSVQKLLKSFPRLEEVRYEPWRGVGTDRPGTRDCAMACMFGSLPFWTKTVSLWQASRPELHGDNADRLPFDNNNLAVGAAGASRRLKHFSASFAFDAMAFFSGGLPPTTAASRGAGWNGWPELTSLALTSEDLRRGARTGAADALICAAAAAATHLPRLRVMELWCSGSWEDNEGLIFRYESAGGLVAEIAVEATWDFRPSEAARRAWRDVAARHGHDDFRERFEVFAPRYSETRYFMCHRLRLKDLVREKL